MYGMYMRQNIAQHIFSNFSPFAGHIKAQPGICITLWSVHVLVSNCKFTTINPTKWSYGVHSLYPTSVQCNMYTLYCVLHVFSSSQYIRFCQWKYLELLTPYLVSYCVNCHRVFQYIHGQYMYMYIIYMVSACTCTIYALLSHMYVHHNNTLPSDADFSTRLQYPQNHWTGRVWRGIRLSQR